MSARDERLRAVVQQQRRVVREPRGVGLLTDSAVEMQHDVVARQADEARQGRVWQVLERLQAAAARSGLCRSRAGLCVVREREAHVWLDCRRLMGNTAVLPCHASRPTNDARGLCTRSEAPDACQPRHPEERQQHDVRHRIHAHIHAFCDTRCRLQLVPHPSGTRQR
jgi:hypothetical protein